MKDYNYDRKWADNDNHKTQIADIVRSLVGEIVKITVAPPEEDTKRATDYTIVIEGTSIGCRLRTGIGFLYRYGDVTFRKSRPSGVRTEFDKIREGYPRWYLYGWVNNSDAITHWVFIDMDRFRETLIDKVDTEKPNHDGTTFVGFNIVNLYNNNCLRNWSPAVYNFITNGVPQRPLSQQTLFGVS